MKIAVVGTGYVGLVTGTCFADMGHEVVCVDLDVAKIEGLNQGKIPIYEPGLQHLVSRNRREGRLTFSTDLQASVKNRQAIFIAVGTPPGEDGRADLKYVLAAAQSIGKGLNDYAVVINKSTVPVGTGEKVQGVIAEYTKQPFDVVSNPEFLKEGTAVEDFLKPDRVVIGCASARARSVMEELYAPFLRNNHPILFMDVKSAELTKYAANAMLALRISFMNEMANLCDAMGADVNMVRRGIGSDRRIGSSFLYPGIGYGGSCFPKDVKALLQTATEAGHPSAILRAVEEVNEHQKRILPHRIFHRFGKDLKGKHFTLWGLSFKPETDDIREAPSLVILETLRAAGATVSGSDPEAMAAVAKSHKNQINLVADAYEALTGADALILCTEWNEYRNPDFARMAQLMRQPVIFDGRNLWRDRPEMSLFEYTCIGSNPKGITVR